MTEATAHRAWSRGWPGVPAFEVALAEERTLAAQLPSVLRVESVVAEVTAGAADLHAELRRLQPAVAAIVDTLVGRVELGEFAAKEPDAAMGQLARLARVHRDVLAVVRDAVELRRLVDGEATAIIGHKAMAPSEPIDLDKARAEVEATMRAIRRAEGAKLVEVKRLTEGADDGGAVH